MSSEAGKDNDDYMKFYKLNDEGIIQYGILKKQELYNTLKWSFFGTAIGVSASYFVESLMKKTSDKKKDIVKSFILMSFVLGFTFIGHKSSMIKTHIKQKELIEKYGVEITEQDE